VHAFFWAFILTFIFTFWYLLLVRDFFNTDGVKNLLNSEQTFQSDVKEINKPSFQEQTEKYKQDVSAARESIKFNFEGLLHIKDSFKKAVSGEQTF
jgi:hypothetical protein